MMISRELVEAFSQVDDNIFGRLIALSGDTLSSDDFALLVMDASIIRHLACVTFPHQIRALCAQSLIQASATNGDQHAVLRRVVLEQIYQCELTDTESRASVSVHDTDLFQLSRLAALDFLDEIQPLIGWLRENLVLNMHRALYKNAAMSLVCLQRADPQFPHIYHSAYQHLCFVTRTLGLDEISAELYFMGAERPK